MGDLLTRFLLPLSGAGIGWVAVLMSRKGATRARIEAERADEVRAAEAEKGLSEERRAEVGQRMQNMQTVIDRVLAENVRLVAENMAVRMARDAAELRANTETDRIREDWESRWARQMDRCRKITEPLVDAIAEFSKKPGNAAAKAAGRRATDNLDDHNLTDHNPEEHHDD